MESVKFKVMRMATMATKIKKAMDFIAENNQIETVVQIQGPTISDNEAEEEYMVSFIPFSE